jgi:glycosyltransferase involved in cell wall biosynthesis
MIAAKIGGRVVAPSVRLSIIIPTCGRPSLYATLHSIVVGGVSKFDQIIVVGDGPQPEAQRIVSTFIGRLPFSYHETAPHHAVGHPQRVFGMTKATGTHLMFMDDDDVYADGAIDLVRREVSTDPGKVFIFRMKGLAKRLGYDLLWSEKRVGIGNIGTPMFVVPNVPDRLGKWTYEYAGDFAFIESTVAKTGEGAVEWREDVIALIR